MSRSINAGAVATAIAAGLAMAQAADAGTMNISRDTTNFTGNIGGGEYGVSNFSPITSIAAASSPMKITGYDFQSFCVEGNQSMSAQSLNWSLATSINNDSSKPLRAGTAYLYTNFWNGSSFSEPGKAMLSDGSGLDSSSSTTTHAYTYNYTQGTGRIASANDLQEAIWWFQGDWLNTFSTLSSNARELVTAATIATSSGGSWYGQWGANGIGAVRVLVLTDLNGVGQQDILVLVPVPLPSAALLGFGLMIGIGALRTVRRKRLRRVLE